MCLWYYGDISEKLWSAWIGESTGNCYPHGAEDYEFEAFTKIIANGWPVAKVATAARLLFGDEGECVS